MRYITVPKDAVLRARANPGQEPPTYSFRNYLVLDLFRDPRWSVDAEWESALDAVSTAFGLDGADLIEPGTVVALDSAAHEKLEAAARAFQPSSDLKAALRWHLRAITQADRLDPRPPKPAPAGGA